MAGNEEDAGRKTAVEQDDPDTAEVLRIAALDDAAEPTSRFLVFGPTKRLLARVRAERERRERAWRAS